MDKPLSALPKSPRAQQQQLDDLPHRSSDKSTLRSEMKWYLIWYLKI